MYYLWMMRNIIIINHYYNIKRVCTVDVRLFLLATELRRIRYRNKLDFFKLTEN